MAIEKGIGSGGEQLLVDGIAPEQVNVEPMMLENPSIQQMDDGSVLVGEIEEQIEVTAPVPFDANLADYIDSGELGRVSSDLVSDIEEDMSSRKILTSVALIFLAWSMMSALNLSRVPQV
jgi:hypothetical protein